MLDRHTAFQQGWSMYEFYEDMGIDTELRC